MRASESFRPPVATGRIGIPHVVTAEGMDPRFVLAGLRAASKPAALSLLARHAASLTALDPTRIHRALEARERLGSTGVGRGIAIPHARLDELDRPCIVFARLVRPIDFQGMDEQPVDLLFLLLSPAAECASHLKTLSRIARLSHDAALCRKLRETTTSDGVCGLLIETLFAAVSVN